MPFDPAASLPSRAKRNYRWLTDGLAGVHLSDAERATLIHLAAGQDSDTIRRLAAVMARARSATSPMDALHDVPDAVLPPVAANVMARHGLG